MKAERALQNFMKSSKTHQRHTFLATNQGIDIMREREREYICIIFTNSSRLQCIMIVSLFIAEKLEPEAEGAEFTYTEPQGIIINYYKLN